MRFECGTEKKSPSKDLYKVKGIYLEEWRRWEMKEQITIRLTIRTPEDLEQRLRNEAARRGMSVNQMMLNILHRYFKNQRV